MEAILLERTSGTIYVHICTISTLPHVPLTLADVWMRPVKCSGGSDYYEYILLYTDDALVVSDNAEQVLWNELGRYFTLKEESIGPPKIYLGGHVRKVQLDNGDK